jgi:hypothetical protein
MPQSGLVRINRSTATAVNKRWVPFLPRWMVNGTAAPKPHIPTLEETEEVQPPEVQPERPPIPPVRPLSAF